jgi:hypothetical protein
LYPAPPAVDLEWATAWVEDLAPLVQLALPL